MWRNPDGANRLLRKCPEGTQRSARLHAHSRLFESGFTLIEIMVVILVLGLLAALVAPNIFGHLGTAKEETARAQIELFGAALDAYRLHTGVYPTTEQGLEALRREPLSHPQPRNWRGPYVRKEIPPDPWGNPYEYRSPIPDSVKEYELSSLGKDGELGGEAENADIHSWE